MQQPPSRPGTRLAIALLGLAARLPPWGRRAVAAALGALLVLVAPARRRIAAVNLALCLPGLDARDRARLLRRNFDSFALGLLEAFRSWRQDDAGLLTESVLHGQELLDRAHADGCGVLLLGLHMDSLERAICALGVRVQFDFVFRRQSDPAWDRLLHAGRSRRVARLIPREDPRAIVRALRDGHTVWYLPDQDYGARHSVFAPLFGVPAATLTAAARIARAARARVLWLTHHRAVDGRLVLSIEDALPGYAHANTLAAATALNAVIEQTVNAHPEQYLWVHRRFKTRPPGQSRLYPG